MRVARIRVRVVKCKNRGGVWFNLQGYWRPMFQVIDGKTGKIIYG